VRAVTTFALVVALALLVATRPARADGHRKKVIGATLIGVGSVLDAATTALTFAGLARGGWTLTPATTTDTALLWSGVAGNFALDTVLTMGIVIYCQGGDEMRRAKMAR
jgi:hypothetical protein